MLRSLATAVGASHVVTDADVLAGRSVDHTGRYRGRASALTGEHLGVGAPVSGDWLLLVELAADHDQTDRLAGLLEGVQMCGEPAVGVDVGAQQRLWRVRES